MQTNITYLFGTVVWKSRYYLKCLVGEFFWPLRLIVTVSINFLLINRCINYD